MGKQVTLSYDEAREDLLPSAPSFIGYFWNIIYWIKRHWMSDPSGISFSSVGAYLVYDDLEGKHYGNTADSLFLSYAPESIETYPPGATGPPNPNTMVLIVPPSETEESKARKEEDQRRIKEAKELIDQLQLDTRRRILNGEIEREVERIL